MTQALTIFNDASKKTAYKCFGQRRSFSSFKLYNVKKLNLVTKISDDAASEAWSKPFLVSNCISSDILKTKVHNRQQEELRTTAQCGSYS